MSSFDELDNPHDRPQPEALRRSLSESDCKSSKTFPRVSPLVGTVEEEQSDARAAAESTLPKSDSFERVLKEKLAERRKVVLVEGARSSFSDEVNDLESQSEGSSEGTGLITSTALGEDQVKNLASVELPEELGPVLQMETPKEEREPIQAIDDLEKPVESKDAGLDQTSSEESEPMVEDKESVMEGGDSSGGEVVGYESEEGGVQASEVAVKSEEPVEVPEEVNVVTDLAPEEKFDAEGCWLSSEVAEAASEKEEETHSLVKDVGENDEEPKAVTDEGPAKESCLEQPPAYQDTHIPHGVGIKEAGVESVVCKPDMETSVDQALAPQAHIHETVDTEALVVPATKAVAQGVTSVDTQARACEPSLPFQVRTRDIVIEDVEDLKKFRNSCSQVDDLTQPMTVQNVRQSADIAMGQLEECTTGDSSQGRQPRWRWVRKVVAPVTFVTGAVILKIVAH